MDQNVLPDYIEEGNKEEYNNGEEEYYDEQYERDYEEDDDYF